MSALCLIKTGDSAPFPYSISSVTDQVITVTSARPSLETITVLPTFGALALILYTFMCGYSKKYLYGSVFNVMKRQADGRNSTN